jgi:hypothetical protein
MENNKKEIIPEDMANPAEVNELPEDFDTREDDQDLSEYEHEQLEDFRAEIQRKKAAGEDPHLHDVHPEDLGEDDHKLYKFFKKYKKEGWPELRVTIFEKKKKHYVNTSLHDLIEARGHKDRAVKSKNSFQAYLENKMLAVTFQRREK